MKPESENNRQTGSNDGKKSPGPVEHKGIRKSVNGIDRWVEDDHVYYEQVVKLAQGREIRPDEVFVVSSVS